MTVAVRAPDGSGTQPAAAAPPVAAAVDEPQDTVLLVVERDDGVAESLTLLAGPGSTGRASITFIPTGTLVEIPGFGLERLAAAHRAGGGALVESSLENVLGIAVDHHVVVDRALLGDFLGRVGALQVQVPERLVADGSDGPQVAFERGTASLDGATAVEYWTFRSAGDDELAALSRQQDVWAAVLDVLASDATARDRALADGAPQLVPVPEPDGGAVVPDLLDALAEARADGRLGTRLLPVRALGTADGATTYQPVEGDVAELAARTLAGSRLDVAASGRLRVQILNGIGTPGVGRAVDARLDGEPIRVVLTDNARTFDHDETRIVVYDDDPALRRAAEQVRARLGVGTIERSRQPQSVVDLTIVVGSDFSVDG